MAKRRGRRRGTGAAHAGAPAAFEDVEARAARLGITPDRVLREYRRIAFANLRHIVEWDDNGMQVKPTAKLLDEDVAAIAEIVETADTHKPYRIKLYDKKAALDALARHLSMFPLPPRQPEGKTSDNEEEDPRAFLEREIARLAADGAGEAPDLVVDPGAGAKTET